MLWNTESPSHSPCFRATALSRDAGSNPTNRTGGSAVLLTMDAVDASRETVAYSDATGLAKPLDDAAFSAVFDSSGEALLLLDSMGVIQRANKRARELLHLKEVDRRAELKNSCPDRSRHK